MRIFWRLRFRTGLKAKSFISFNAPPASPVAEAVSVPSSSSAKTKPAAPLASQAGPCTSIKPFAIGELHLWFPEDVGDGICVCQTFRRSDQFLSTLTAAYDVSLEDTRHGK